MDIEATGANRGVEDPARIPLSVFLIEISGEGRIPNEGASANYAGPDSCDVTDPAAGSEDCTFHVVPIPPLRQEEKKDGVNGEDDPNSAVDGEPCPPTEPTLDTEAEGGRRKSRKRTAPQVTCTLGKG